MSELLHESIRPDRQDIIGEVVFSEHWKRLMAQQLEFDSDYEDDAPRLSSIIGRRANQRAATVAATIVQWLGTNVGGSLLYEAERVRRVLNNTANCFLMQWAVENCRRGYLNRGVRILEVLMVKPDVQRDWAGHPYEIASITKRDIETVEQLMLWLGSTRGYAWLAGVEAEITIRRDAARHYQRAKSAPRNIDAKVTG